MDRRIIIAGLLGIGLVIGALLVAWQPSGEGTVAEAEPVELPVAAKAPAAPLPEARNKIPWPEELLDEPIPDAEAADELAIEWLADHEGYHVVRCRVPDWVEPGDTLLAARIAPAIVRDGVLTAMVESGEGVSVVRARTESLGEIEWGRDYCRFSELRHVDLVGVIEDYEALGLSTGHVFACTADTAVDAGGRFQVTVPVVRRHRDRLPRCELHATAHSNGLAYMSQRVEVEIDERERFEGIVLVPEAMFEVDLTGPAIDHELVADLAEIRAQARESRFASTLARPDLPDDIRSQLETWEADQADRDAAWEDQLVDFMERTDADPQAP